MTTVAAYTVEASTQLGDQGSPTFVRWTQAELVQYLNNALGVISTFRPDAFTTTVTITLVPGNKQTLPTGSSSLKSVDSNGPTANCVGSPIVEADLNFMRAYHKAPCTPTGGDDNYVVRSYGYDTRAPKIFYVTPPVPTGIVNLQVTATVIIDTPVYTTGTLASTVAIDEKYHAAIIQWMLRCAWEVDTESASSRQSKMDAEAEFWKLLGIPYKQESSYKSGYFLGQVGTKDTQAGRR